MNEPRHTPGPWYVGDTRCIYAKLQTVDGTFVEPLIAQCTKLTTSADANAALISAAPEMLEALEYTIAIFKAMGQRSTKETHLGALEALVAKAKARGGAE